LPKRSVSSSLASNITPSYVEDRSSPTCHYEEYRRSRPPRKPIVGDDHRSSTPVHLMQPHASAAVALRGEQRAGGVRRRRASRTSLMSWIRMERLLFPRARDPRILVRRWSWMPMLLPAVANHAPWSRGVGFFRGGPITEEGLNGQKLQSNASAPAYCENHVRTRFAVCASTGFDSPIARADELSIESGRHGAPRGRSMEKFVPSGHPSESSQRGKSTRSPRRSRLRYARSFRLARASPVRPAHLIRDMKDPARRVMRPPSTHRHAVFRSLEPAQ